MALTLVRKPPVRSPNAAGGSREPPAAQAAGMASTRQRVFQPSGLRTIGDSDQ